MDYENAELNNGFRFATSSKDNVGYSALIKILMRYSTNILLCLFFLPLLSVVGQTNMDKKYFDDQIVVAKGDQQFAPFEFVNAQGQSDGFSVELFKVLM